MREPLRKFIIDNVGELRIQAGGVTDYTRSPVKELHGVTRDTPRPFVVIATGPLDPGQDWAGIATAVEIWPHVEYESFVDLDTLATKLSRLLNETMLEGDGARYYFEQIATGGDQMIPEWETLTRALRFQAFDLGFLSSETYEPDPVEALARWTRETFGVDLQTDPSSWKPSNDQPAVYWRISTIPRILEQYPEHVWLEGRVMGHVIAPDYRTRLEWTRRLHTRLALARRLELSDGSPLFIEGAGADSAAHPLRTGQITLVCRWGELVEHEERPVVAHAFIGGDVPTQEVE